MHNYLLFSAQTTPKSRMQRIKYRTTNEPIYMLQNHITICLFCDDVRNKEKKKNSVWKKNSSTKIDFQVLRASGLIKEIGMNSASI